MEHKEIRQMLSAYLDNAVSAAEKAEIERHLAECGNCRGALADLERTVAHLKDVPEVEPPPWLTAKIMAHIRDEVGQKQGFWRRLFAPLSVKLPLEVLALVCLCITGYYLAQTTAPQMRLTDMPREAREEAPPPPPAQPKPEAPVRKAPASGPSAPAKKPAAVTPPVSPSAVIKAPGGYAPPPLKAPATTPAPAPIYRAPEIASRPAVEWGVPGNETPRREEVQREKARREMLYRGEAMKSAREGNDASDAMMQKKGVAGTQYSPDAVSRPPMGFAQPEYRRESAGVTARAKPVEVTLRVDDPAAAVDGIEEAVTRSGGRIIRRVYGGTDHLLSVQVEARRFPELIARLERIGTLRKPVDSAGAEGTFDLFIRW
jgi:anti-sigma factor RsiW